MSESRLTSSASHEADAPGLTFGIYPGGPAGCEAGLITGAADNPERIREALDQLQPRNQPFLVRGYMLYVGSGKVGYQAPAEVERYVTGARKLDLVLCYRVAEDDLSQWTCFVRSIVNQYAPELALLQITQEANSSAPGGDGDIPNVRDALVSGLIAAKEEIQRLGLGIRVGFSATPNSEPRKDFWPSLAQMGGQTFVDALDYVGLDFFPDVFRPVGRDGSPTCLRSSVLRVLHHFRNVDLAAAHIPADKPIHIGENGWSTGPGRPYERQAVVLETILRTLSEHRAEFNLTHYEYFDLRDVDSSKSEYFQQFGLLRDDYAAKPAFECYRRLIAELGRQGGAHFVPTWMAAAPSSSKR